jgi:gliding motility-associated lipoprotein GldD
MNKYCFYYVFLCFLAVSVLYISSCNSDYTLRRKGYFKIDFPRHEYKQFNIPGYPYSFEYPVYASVVQDTSLFADNDTPYWINIDFPRFNGKIYISYKVVNKTNFNKLVNDAFTMTYKHSSKATEIQDSLMKTEAGLTGVWFTVGGNAATARQFFITDSVKHFLRGALYFDTTPNEDSLNIVNDFLQEDMKHLINTLKWKEQ